MIVLQIRVQQQFLESRLTRRARHHPSVVTGPVAMTTDASRTVPVPVWSTAEKHGHQPYELNASLRPPPFASPSTEHPNAHVPTASALTHVDIHADSTARMSSLTGCVITNGRSHREWEQRAPQRRETLQGGAISEGSQVEDWVVRIVESRQQVTVMQRWHIRDLHTVRKTQVVECRAVVPNDPLYW